MPARPGSGRKAFMPTAEQKKLVEALSGYGIPQEDICRLVTDNRGQPISDRTLRKAFRHELDNGAVKANAKVAEALFKHATGGGKEGVVAAIFWLKTRAGWKEPQHVNVAIKRSLADFSDEEIAAIVGNAAVPDGTDPQDDGA
jgi:hypothetical protein